MNLLRAKTFLSNFRSHSPLTTEVILYLAVGVLGTLVDFGCFFIFLYFSAPPIFAQWLASSAGFFHNHLWQHYFVFKHQQNLSRTTFWSTFFSIITIAASGPALVLLQEVFDNLIVNKIVVIGITTVFLFVIRKLFIFKDRKI